MEHDYKKLQAFVEAALTNPKHPIYSIGFSKSQILQHYATNVMVLEAVKPEQWFKDYPQYTAKIEEAIRILETPEPVPVLPSHDEVVKEANRKIEPTDKAKEELDKVGIKIEEAAMKVKCPKCGEEFSVPMKGA